MEVCFKDLGHFGDFNCKAINFFTGKTIPYEALNPNELYICLLYTEYPDYFSKLPEKYNAKLVEYKTLYGTINYTIVMPLKENFCNELKIFP